MLQKSIPPTQYMSMEHNQKWPNVDINLPSDKRNCFVSAETNEGRNVLTLCNIRESSLSMFACLVSLKSRENL